MKIETKSRNELKAYFRKNSIPTESNFADLIDGMLIHKDDGIAKLPGNPLSIEADGSVQQKVINFYRDLEEDAPAWSLSLNPKSKPADPNSATRSGFSMSDSTGNSRLFIDKTTGNIGIGTISPQDKLDINGGIVFKGNPSSKLSGDSRSNRNTLVLKGHWNELEVKGRVIDWTGSNLHIGFDNNHANHMIEIGRNVGSLSFLSGGGVNETMRITDGKVGIGTTQPSDKLHVAGKLRIDGAIQPSAGNSEANGIMFPKNPGGGGGDAAWIRYYAKSGENTILEIGTSNDRSDHIVLNASGNVGIGTINPAGNYRLVISQRMSSPGHGIRLLNANSTKSCQLWVGTGGAVVDAEGTTHLHLRTAGKDRIVINNSGNINVSTASNISFGNKTRQMINLWSTTYGIGIQSGTMYFRSNTHYAWHKGGSHNDTALSPGSGGIRLMALNSAGDLTIRRRALKPGGGSWGSSSDIRLKKDIHVLHGPLDKLLQLRGVSFKWKEPEKQGNLTGNQMGFIAQEIEKVFPEWVDTDADEFKTLSIRGFEALTVEAIRELHNQLKETLSKLNELESSVYA